MPVSDEHKARVLAHINNQPAVIRAVYTEWKMVKTRNALVLCFEVPLEEQELVQQALGTPLQGESTHVAIARLRDGAAPQIEPPGRSGSRAQRAGILCNEGAFQRWAEERGYHPTPDGAAEFLRYECGVESRKELDKNEAAGRRFLDLKADYGLWLKDAAA